jgi:hypothetical protein
MNPTPEQAVKEMIHIVGNVKATKAEHDYLERCLNVLIQAIKPQSAAEEARHDA